MLSISKTEKNINDYKFDEFENFVLDLNMESRYFAMVDSLYPQLCQIVKIGKKGITLRYYEDSNILSEEGNLDLLKTGSGFANQNLHYTKINERVIENSYNMSLRESELRFTNPDISEIYAIKDFMENIDECEISLN